MTHLPPLKQENPAIALRNRWTVILLVSLMLTFAVGSVFYLRAYGFNTDKTTEKQYH